jgi:RTX calcium-binding nonapeptide repeat (4 copies)/Divergent InlB B-repeat domain
MSNYFSRVNRRAPLVLLLVAGAAAALGLIGTGSARAVDTPPLLVTLTVEKSGSAAGIGQVTGPGGIDCGSTCSAAFPPGTSLVLDAPDPSNAMMKGWEGCDHLDGGWDCHVTLTTSRTVTANFELYRSLTVSFAGDGAGTLSGLDGDCPSSSGGCVVQGLLNDGDTVHITAHPDPGSTFGGWNGACSGSQTSCDLQISGDMALTASFEKAPAPAPDPDPGPAAPQPTPAPDLPAPAPGTDPAPAPGEHDTVPATCTVTGTPGDDVLAGTHGRDVICGLSGNDRLAGKGGLDVLLGGSGADILTGGPGNDRLAGGNGSDRLLGGAGKDRLEGGAGNDALVGGRGADALLGAKGVDLLLARDGRQDRLDGGRGRDRARVDRTKDVGRRIETLV